MEVKEPRARTWRLKMENQHSIGLSQDACFGVKCRVHRGCSSNHSLTSGVVRRQVVHDDVSAAWRIDDVDDVEQLDECVAVVRGRGEAERFAAAYIERAHPAERAVADVLELAAQRLAWLHRDVSVAALEGL